MGTEDDDDTFLSYDQAVDNLEAALLFQEILAFTSILCSAFALYVMLRMQVYRNRLMFIVFGMNLLQFTYVYSHCLCIYASMHSFLFQYIRLHN